MAPPQKKVTGMQLSASLHSIVQMQIALTSDGLASQRQSIEPCASVSGLYQCYESVKHGHVGLTKEYYDYEKYRLHL